MALSSKPFFSQLLGVAAPDIRCAADVMVLAVHSIILGRGFSCNGTGECDEPLVRRMPSERQSGNGGAIYQKILPSNWASASREGGAYNFEYSHPRSAWGCRHDAPAKETQTNTAQKRIVTLKALVVGGQVLFHTVDSANPDHVFSLELKVSDALSDEAFQQIVAKPVEERDFEPLCTAGFVKAMEKTEKNVLQKLLPNESWNSGEAGLQEKGSEQFKSTEKSSSNPADGTAFRAPPIFSGQTPTPLPGMFSPDGNLIGPSHPAWGATRPGMSVPGGLPGANPGMRFDPLGPLGPFGCEPDPDHLPRPGFGPHGFI